MSVTEVTISQINWGPLLAKHPTIIICGARGSGKSVMVKDIMFEAHQIGVPRCVVFSQTENANSHFASFVPGICVHCPITVEAVANVWTSQKELAIKKRVGQIPSTTDISLIMVMDDAAFNKKLIASPGMREIFLNGRHSSITLIMTLQYVMDLPVSMRSNADIGVFLNDTNQKNRERIFNNFCGCFSDFYTFNRTFSDCTENNEAFCVNRKAKSNAISDCINYYKARNDLDYKFGAPETWKYHDKRFLSEEEDYLLKQARLKQLSSGEGSTKTTTSGKGDTLKINRI